MVLVRCRLPTSSTLPTQLMPLTSKFSKVTGLHRGKWLIFSVSTRSIYLGVFLTFSSFPFAPLHSLHSYFTQLIHLLELQLSPLKLFCFTCLEFICSAGDTKDEPYAWDAREFLRKKVIGEPVLFVSEVSSNNREYGVIYLGKGKSSY